MLTFEQMTGEGGQMTLIGSMQSKGDRRRSSAFAQLQRGMYSMGIWSPGLPIVLNCTPLVRYKDPKHHNASSMITETVGNLLYMVC